MTRLQSLYERYWNMHNSTALAIQKGLTSPVWKHVAELRLKMMARLQVKIDSEELRLL